MKIEINKCELSGVDNFEMYSVATIPSLDLKIQT